MKKYEKPAKHYAFKGEGFEVRYYYITDDECLAALNGEDNCLPVNSWEDANKAVIVLDCCDELYAYSDVLLHAGAFIASLNPVADWHFVDFDKNEPSRNSIWVYKAARKSGHCHPGHTRRDTKSALVWNESTQDWR